VGARRFRGPRRISDAFYPIPPGGLGGELRRSDRSRRNAQPHRGGTADRPNAPLTDFGAPGQ